MFGQMDPFVRIVYNGTTFKTKTDSGSGKHPIWNETFIIKVDSMDDNILFSCYDEDFLTNDLVGEATISIASLCSS